MAAADVPACQQVWHETWNEMRARFGLPTVEIGDDEVERVRRRLAHLLATDPGGSWVADDAGDVVGLAQALRRDGLWVLSLFGVLARAQGRGLARRLLQASLAHARPDDRGLIVSSRDPRAIATYGRAGFALHPAVTAWGQVRHPVDRPVGVRQGGVDDYPLIESVSRTARGAAHGRADIELLLEQGLRLLVVDDRGYALVVPGGRPQLVAATDEDAARLLVRAALADADAGREVELGWITAANQWAMDEALAAGLELHPVGPVCVRGMGPPAPYLANGMLG